MKLELLKGSRSRILAALILGIAAVFIGRLFYLQVIQHGHYRQLAEQEQVMRTKIPATRGEIYALDNGKPEQLVMNETVYTVFADPVMVDDKDKVLEVMRRIAGGNMRANFEELMDNRNSRYQIIATKVTRTQADKIKQEKLRGIGFQAVSQRVYREGGLAAQVLGFVNVEGVGNYGIEQAMNEQLKGVDGRLESVTDVSDVPLTIGDRNINEPAQNGKNIVLSIDRKIQVKAEQALAAGLQRTGADQGSVLIMNPQNGQIMAMANLPTYNPAEYFKVEDPEAFNNNTISNPYEPGSDIKTLTMAVGIDKGVVKPNDTFYNTDTIKVDDRVIGNASKGHTGEITFQTALNWSLNTGFVTVAQRLGNGSEITRSARDTIYDYFYNKFRLGQLTGVELSGELTGNIVSPTTVEGNAVRYSNMSFGQGMDATMIQVSSAFSAMINGGNYYKPTVIAGEMTDEGYKPAATAAPIGRVVSQSTSEQMRDMIYKARQAFYSQADKQGYYVGGKTGTSETIVNGQYSDKQTIGTYLGFGGRDTPQYVIMIEVSGKGKALQGARDALPIFTDISNWMLDYLKIQPKGY